MFKVFLILDLYTSSNSWQDLLINKSAHAHTAVSPRYSPIAKDVSCPVRGGGEGTWDNFCFVGAAGLSEPLLHYSLFCGQL